jgi:hypothetical protein
LAGFDNDVVFANNLDFSGGSPVTGKVTTNGQLLIGSTVAPNIRVGSLTSSGGTVAITTGAGTINLESGGSVPTTFIADSGSASPVGNQLNVLGGPGVTTSASGSTLTINSVVFTDTGATTLVSDNGYFANAAGTYTLPATPNQGELIIIACDTAGAVVVDAPGTQLIRIGASQTSAGGTATSTSIGDSLTLRYRASNTTWFAVSSMGTWITA